MTTLRNLVGLPSSPSALSESALILVDVQNTYLEGTLKLDGVDQSIVQIKSLLDRARTQNIPVIHIQHNAGVGSPYDVTQRIGQIADLVAPKEGEKVIVKSYPSSFEQTNLNETLSDLGIKKIIVVGYMSHMCINSTARAGFNLGYQVTVVANATGTRDLPDPVDPSKTIPASQIHSSVLAALSDLPSIVVANESDVPN